MKSVYVGMSGGVDSSVAAALLTRQGFSVTGVYMKNWTQDVAGVACPWRQDLADARAVAARLDIPFRIFDFQAEYKQLVVDTMIAEYAAGRTPNPDIMCNQEIKFKLFLEACLADGADLIATGHYARTQEGMLLTARDESKDQTYFLYRVTREALERTVFPLGDMMKSEVRAEARRLKLPTAAKPDSQGICFVGEVGIKAFLSQYVTAAAGDIVDRASGQVLGRHDGALFYTPGQRHGLGIGGGKPFYVTAKDMASNIVFVSADPEDVSLTSDAFALRQVHWINGQPGADEACTMRIRHRGELAPCVVRFGGGVWSVQLEKPVRALAAGQSAVVYRGHEVLGGGIIDL